MWDFGKSEIAKPKVSMNKSIQEYQVIHHFNFAGLDRGLEIVCKRQVQLLAYSKCSINGSYYCFYYQETDDDIHSIKTDVY